MNLHTGENSFICKFPGCNLKYKQASQLSCHRLLHKSKTENPVHCFYDLKTLASLVIELFGKKPSHLTTFHKKGKKSEKVLLPPVSPQSFDIRLPVPEILIEFEEN
jgi:hypothetical protein